MIVYKGDGKDPYDKYEKFVNYMHEIDLSTAYLQGAYSEQIAIPVDVKVEFLYCTNKPNCKNREETKEFLAQNFSFVVMAFEQYLDMNDRDNPVKQRITSFADTFSRQRYMLNYLSLNTYII